MAWSEQARLASIAARRAAAHQNGVGEVGRDSVDPRVLNVIRSNPNGASVSPRGDVPTRGYMVSVPGRTLKLSDRDLRGPGAQGIISDYARKNSDLLGQSGAHIGVWRDKVTGMTHLDVSRNISRQREAIRTGRSSNQIAIYDVRRKREIRTGGKGD